MISYKLKRIYHATMSPLLAISAATYRVIFAPTSKNSSIVRVHLGPGQMNYLSGWINVDYNLATAKLDVWSDLEKALPFRNNSVDAFYSHHVIEHIRLECLPYHFSEMFRCLKAGGLIRVGGPNGDSAIRRLLDLDGDWFGEFPKRYRSVGGRFNNFVFCNNEHFWMITADFLQELAEDAGFSDFGVKRAKSETGHPDLFEAAVLAGEHCSEHEYAETLMIEARKPE